MGTDVGFALPVAEPPGSLRRACGAAKLCGIHTRQAPRIPSRPPQSMDGLKAQFPENLVAGCQHPKRAAKNVGLLALDASDRRRG